MSSRQKQFEINYRVDRSDATVYGYPEIIFGLLDENY